MEQEWQVAEVGHCDAEGWTNNYISYVLGPRDREASGEPRNHPILARLGQVRARHFQR